MNISNKSNNDFKINGTSNAKECGAFDHIYMIIGEKSKWEGCTLLLDENGNLNLYDFMPNIRENEVYTFLNKPLRIYRNELSNGIITTSLRGMTNTDFVHLPNSSPVDLRWVIHEEQLVPAFLVDTATDEIKGVRIVGLSDKTISQLLKDWVAVEDRGFSTEEISETLNDSVYCHSPEVFQKRSEYVGRDISSMVAKSNFFPSM